MADERRIIPSRRMAPEDLADNNESLVQIATSMPEAQDLGLYTGQGPQAQRVQWGNVFTVNMNGGTGTRPSNSGPLVAAISPPAFPEERDCTVVLQILPNAVIPSPTQTGNTTSNVVAAFITYGIGAAQLLKIVYLTSCAERRVQLCCRSVQVSLQVINLADQNPANAPVQVAVALVPGHTLLRDCYLWSPGNTLDGVSHGVLWPPTAVQNGALQTGAGGGAPTNALGIGSLGSLTVILESVASTVAGQNLYPLLFDLPPGYAFAGGEVPLANGVGGALVTAGQFMQFSNVELPESVSFTAGLQFALSTTAGTYTAATGAVTAHVDCVVGQ